jgi:hypothetical protein
MATLRMIYYSYSRSGRPGAELDVGLSRISCLLFNLSRPYLSYPWQENNMAARKQHGEIKSHYRPSRTYVRTPKSALIILHEFIEATMSGTEPNSKRKSARIIRLAQGLRPVQIWVPDVRAPAFIAAAQGGKGRGSKSQDDFIGS